MRTTDAQLAATVPGREAAWLNDDPALLVPSDPPEPLGVLVYDRRESVTVSRAVLTRVRTGVRRLDQGSDLHVHQLRLRVDWPYDTASVDVVDAQFELEGVVELLVRRITQPDKNGGTSHGGLWLSAADDSDSGLGNDVTVEFSDPSAPFGPLADDSVPTLTAVLTWSVTEQRPRLFT